MFSHSNVLNRHYYGFSLYDLDSNKFVYGIKEDLPFTPASNTKVFTLFTSLKVIGDSIPGIEYIEKGDSLLFWGTGDPTFLHPKLDTRRVYDFLKNSDKKLFYVRQQASEPAYREGWSAADYNAYYQPEVATFPIYGNVVRFKAQGRSVVSFPSYFERYVEVRHSKSKYFSLQRKRYSNTFEMNSVNVPKSYYATKPFIWSDTLLVSLLQDTLKKEVSMLLDVAKPDDVKTLYSAPRNALLRDMMLPSDNFLAEQLTMIASERKYNGFYTDSLRVDMQRDYYTQFQDQVNLFDGSGLSIFNKVSPRSMIELLLAINEIVPDDTERYHFFPTGGVDGTLRRAYMLDQGEPFVWAKTGTLRTVYCQSGYLITRSGRRFAFSFLNNNFRNNASTVRRELVNIMTFLRQNY